MPATASGMLQPLALGSFKTWLTLVLSNRVPLRYWGRAIFVTIVSLILTPLRLYERYAYEHRVESLELAPPVFIVGHWRSGTTRLQNLLCCDRSFGYVTTLQTVAPDLFLTIKRTPVGRLFWPILRLLTPSRRMMDNMKLSLNGPQEEEYALANLSPYSMYHAWSFPRNADRYFRRYALLRGVSSRTRTHWRRMYRRVLQKAALQSGKSRLLLKNPANTGRLRAILRMFPDAKFVHIVRNPYDVFSSTVHLYRKVLETTSMQRFSAAEAARWVLSSYRRLMEAYLRDVEAIPSANRTEVRYEDLDRDPLGTVRGVYERLGLPGFDRVEPDLRAYIQSTSQYRKNQYVLSNVDRERINREWARMFRAFGYEMQDSDGTP